MEFQKCQKCQEKNVFGEKFKSWEISANMVENDLNLFLTSFWTDLRILKGPTGPHLKSQIFEVKSLLPKSSRLVSHVKNFATRNNPIECVLQLRMSVSRAVICPQKIFKRLIRVHQNPKNCP